MPAKAAGGRQDVWVTTSNDQQLLRGAARTSVRHRSTNGARPLPPGTVATCLDCPKWCLLLFFRSRTPRRARYPFYYYFSS